MALIDGGVARCAEWPKEAKGMLLASAPWYEFWAHGAWKVGEWTHLHASGWVWALRGDLLLGVACVMVLLLMLSGEADKVTFAAAAGFVALLLVIPGVTQLLGVAAFFAPAFLVFALVVAGFEQVARLWHGRGDEARVTPSAEPGRSGAKTMKGWGTMR
jgi:hypothetical protein